MSVFLGSSEVVEEFEVGLDLAPVRARDKLPLSEGRRREGDHNEATPILARRDLYERDPVELLDRGADVERLVGVAEDDSP